MATEGEIEVGARAIARRHYGRDDGLYDEKGSLGASTNGSGVPMWKRFVDDSRVALEAAELHRQDWH